PRATEEDLESLFGNPNCEASRDKWLLDPGQGGVAHEISRARPPMGRSDRRRLVGAKSIPRHTAKQEHTSFRFVATRQCGHSLPLGKQRTTPLGRTFRGTWRWLL